MPKTIREKAVFSTNVTGTSGTFCIVKNKQETSQILLYIYTEVNLKWIMILNVQTKTTGFLAESIGRVLCCIRQIAQNLYQKHKLYLKLIDKMDIIKIMFLFSRHLL